MTSILYFLSSVVMLLLICFLAKQVADRNFPYFFNNVLIVLDLLIAAIHYRLFAIGEWLFLDINIEVNSAIKWGALFFLIIHIVIPIRYIEKLNKRRGL